MAADRRVCTYSAGTVGVQGPFHVNVLQPHIREGIGNSTFESNIYLFYILRAVYMFSICNIFSFFCIFASVGHKSNFSF